VSTDQARLIGGFASSLLTASDLLAEDANRAANASTVAMALGYNLTDVENLPQVLAGSAIGEIILRSFTAEVLLKGLITAYGGCPPKKEHDLLKIWNIVPSAARNAMNIAFDSTGSQKIENVFALNPNPFIDWRYLYEASSERSIDVDSLRRITTVLSANLQSVVSTAK
jgi:hypothetical protein